MHQKLFKFQPHKIKNHHANNKTKRRPWRMVALSLMAASFMFGSFANPSPSLAAPTIKNTTNTQQTRQQKAETNISVKAAASLSKSANRATAQNDTQKVQHNFGILTSLVKNQTDPYVKLAIARKIAVTANKETLAQMDKATTSTILSPILSAYIYTRLVNKKSAEIIDADMVHIEGAVSQEILSAAYYATLPDLVLKLPNNSFKNMDHEFANFLTGWLIGAKYKFEGKPLAAKSISTLERMYRNIGLDPDFLQHYAPQRQEWHDYVKSEAVTLNALSASWKNLDDDLKLVLLLPYIAKHSEIFGFDKAPATLYRCSKTPKVEHCKDQKNAGAFHNPKDDKIYINGDASAWNSFDASLSTIIHENTHHHQYSLVMSYRSGKIDKNHATYQQAAYFSASHGHYVNYIPAKNNHYTYQSQPLERHAWWTQKNLSKVRPAAGYNGLKTAPPALEGTKNIKRGTGSASIKAPRPKK